jgi:hypothetical protein
MKHKDAIGELLYVDDSGYATFNKPRPDAKSIGICVGLNKNGRNVEIMMEGGVVLSTFSVSNLEEKKNGMDYPRKAPRYEPGDCSRWEEI